ncbi:SDR family oxidoreductase [Corallococcus exercitus]|uniref:SDR family oxidoreductase n=1 Tax=Corallococcus exercitus TaxID=2316736 RepID=A0A3A8I391_9BACT|nr:SDR family oxidoreductase [Corallococcus exercitus]NOK31596.1 SDR family oxidoreductase [Corallococcus exercitus]RKG77088.1 SDR family oxidoreductase [Corallococcus exercitus]
MDFGLKGRRALVTGASSGLGRAIADTLVKERATVAVSSRGGEKLQKAAKELGAALAVPCDLTQPGAARGLVREVTQKLGGLDVLVVNAGGPPSGGFEAITVEQWQTGFQSLWLATVDAIQEALPGMKAQGWGRIVLVTSTAAREAMNNLTVSNGLRAGLLGLVKSLSNEVAPYGITVNAALPGYHATDRMKDLGLSDEKVAPNIPARRLGRPEEFAALVTFLASEPAAYISGQSIACDGGALKGF